MQQSTTLCPPKPTDAQIQAQIENQHWQEKEQSLANAFNRQYTIQQATIQHQNYIADHYTEPFTILGSVAIVAFTVIYLARKAIAASIVKNREDNAADIVEAQRMLAGRDAA